MKAILNFQTSGRDQSVEVTVENWPTLIRKEDCFELSACGLGEGIAEVLSLTWAFKKETICLVDCMVRGKVLNVLLSSSKLKSVKPPTYLLSDHRWFGKEFD